MSAPDPVRELALEWIRFAQGELNAARTLADNRDDNLLAMAAFHAQQAAEKAIKALCSPRRRFPSSATTT